MELVEGPGQVCDVACYVGLQPTGEHRWILADVRLESRQIIRWAHIFPEPPRDELRAAYEAGVASVQAGETE